MKGFKLFLLVLVWCLAGLTANAQGLPADTDLTFGSNGFVTILTSPSGSKVNAIINDRGNYLAVGTYHISYFKEDGGLLYQSQAQMPNGWNFYFPTSVTTQFDPATGQIKYIVAGSVANSSDSEDVVVARYNDNFSLDRTFGKGGVKQLQINSHTLQVANAVTCQSDGKIIIVGGAGNQWDAFNHFIARLEPDGLLDLSFANSGVAELPIGNHSLAQSVQISKQGIFMGGFLKQGNQFYSTVLRFDFAGNLDPSFNGTGVVTLPGVTGMILTDETGVTVAGVTGGLSWGFGLARFDFNGHPDPNFGVGGISVRPTPTLIRLNSLARQADGKYVAAGTYYASNINVDNYSLLIARYNVDGSPDQNFVSTWNQPFPGTRAVNIHHRSRDAGNAILISRDGKLVVGGSFVDSGQLNSKGLITKFNGF